MGIEFTGHVLRAPRVAPGNAATSSPPVNGVVRDVRVPPSNRDAEAPEVEGLPGTLALVDFASDQYRAAVLEAPGTSPHEYLVWTALSSQLALVEDATWWDTEGSGRLPVGASTLTSLPTVSDGTLKVIVTDDGNRQLGLVTHLVISRGDVTHQDNGWVDRDTPASGRGGTLPYYVVVPAAADQVGGVVTLKDSNVFTATGGALTPSTLAALFAGGLSIERGDLVVEVRYTIAAAKFWWTRNDRYETRFGWNGPLQRWMPYKGAGPVDLGRLLFDETYTLSPPLANLPVGAVLPGNALTGDGYAMLRLGSSAGATSTPVGVSDPGGFTGVVVVSDGDVEGAYDFSGQVISGVVGQTSGTLQFNPLYIEQHAGKTLWYVNQGFAEDSTGFVGNIDDDDLFIAPVPQATDRPFIRINNRTPLAVELAATEAALAAIAPIEGGCAVALTTGRLKLAQADIDKADPTNLAAFDKHYLGAQIIYDGVALNAIPQPTKGPRPLVQADGSTTTLHPFQPMYLPSAIVWPEDHVTADEPYRGLGMSGVLHMPDGTGATPDPEGVDPAAVDIPVRPGGDTLVGPPQTVGLIRQVEDGLGDTILFSKSGAIESLVVVGRNSDLPTFPWDIKGRVAYISREETTTGGLSHSRVQIDLGSRRAYAGEVVYYLQASLNPSVYTELASIASKSRIIFRFDGTEVLYFAIGGTAHDWHSSTLLAALPDNAFFTAVEVAASIQARITAQAGAGICRPDGSRVVLETADPTSGIVEIGWGSPKDRTGAAALGFLPGWHAEAGKPNWLTDAGISMGLSRSLLNLDRSKPTADYLSQYRVEDQVLASSVPAAPFVFLDFPPVEDIAGFDDGVFFNLQTVAIQGDDLRIIDKRLGHFEEIEHRFPEGKVAWLTESISSNPVLQRATTINLGNPAVVPETLLGAPGIGGGFFAAESGGPYALQEQDVDYLITDGGQSGAAQLITRYGARTTYGGQGTYAQAGTTFEDPEANFLADSNDPDIDPATGLQRVDPATGALVWLPVLRAGVRVKLTSGAATGSYIVQSVTDATHCEVAPPFIADAERATPWEAFAGYPDSVYDPAVVADQVYQPFNHLAEEPFKVRVLSPLGTISSASFTANVEDANANSRLVHLRFGPVAAAAGVVATLTPLTLTTIGVIANNQLVLPQTTHVTEGAFNIRVGTEVLTSAAVASFSNDPVEVEYLTAAWDDGTAVHPVGELKFNSGLLVTLRSSGVTLVETLRAAGNLVAGTAEYDPKTGAIRISTADVMLHADEQLYFTEQMVTEGSGSDVKVSPLVGAVSFRKPIATGCLVEMEYWLSDSEGRRVGGVADVVVEFLPVFVRRETATRLTDMEFELDPTGSHVVDTRIDPLVHVGPKQQNFGTLDFTMDRPGHLLGTRLTFDRDLPAWATPVATYAVFDALGGERAFETSQKPVYRPPFFIKAGKDNFGLRGNRMADFEIGQMMRVGSECFYITELRYFADSDLTRLDIYPSTVSEVGSRSPGNDVLTLVTAGPITPTLDPDGAAPIATAAPTGFMQEILLTEFPFEPVNAKQSTITFRGDLTTFAVPGHIMEIAGMPFTIAQAKLSEDGTRTKLTFTSAFRVGVDPAGDPTVRLSYRPVYPPEVRQLVGVGPYVESEGVELTLFGEVEGGVEQPGRRLAEGTEFQIDPGTGVILLVEQQEPLGPGQTFLLSFTRIRAMEPFFSGGEVQFPRWFAQYKHSVLPDADNGYLGGTLTATFTFDNPDSFYFRVLPLSSYLGEAVTQAVAEMKQGVSSGGPALTAPAGDNNWEQGTLGLLAQRRDLSDKDRAARRLLTFYNNAVVAFEQVDECITGKFIGDRDGKFCFWVGQGLEFTPPGFEDQITGELNPSFVWGTVYNEDDPTRDLTFLTSDSLVQPASSTLTDLRLAGPSLGVSQMSKLRGRQRALVRNDVDDVLLIGASTPTLIKEPSFPYFRMESLGSFARMGDPHAFSRLYPTKARVLFTLLPGIGADVAAGEVGSYSWLRYNPVTLENDSTYGEQIGQVSNPVLGDITSVSESVVGMRLPRARIVSYLPNGLAQDALAAGAPAADIDQPCCIVSAVPLADLLIDPDTGYPDITEFLSVGPGEVSDAVAGDPDLALPGFAAGQKVGWGRPDGRILAALFPEDFNLFGVKLYTGVFVEQVLHGCVLTFQDRQGNAIASPSQLLVGTGINSGTPAHLFETTGIGRADTIYVLPPDAEQPIADPAADSPTMADMQQAALLTPTFRQGVDLTVGTDGRVLDLSLPSWTDPFIFPIKEMVGQKTPVPMSHLEGVVEFANVDQLPLQMPALLGGTTDDAGDYQLPYMKGTNTELDRFDEIGTVIGPLMAAGVPGGHYPDEIVFTDGELVAAAAPLGGSYKEPGTLMTPTETDPAAGLGTAPAREGDFLLVEVNPAAPLGWQGFLTIGRLRNAVEAGDDWSWIEPPRFVTQSSKGLPLLYQLGHYAVHTTPADYPPDIQILPPPAMPAGVRLFEDLVGGLQIISFQEVTLALNDAAAAGVGNLNTILAADPQNTITIKLLARPDDVATNANVPLGPGGFLPVFKDGRPLLTIVITQTTVEVFDLMGTSVTGGIGVGGPQPHGGVLFGIFDPLTGEPPPGAVADERHIIFLGAPPNLFDLTPPVGAPFDWYLPHTVTGILKASIYAWECALSINTDMGAAGQSLSAYIDPDRLTFHEAIDFRLARPRGFLHELDLAGNFPYATTLRVPWTSTAALGLVNLNDVTLDDLTFVSREGSITNLEGTWTPAASPNEDGTIRVMAFEWYDAGGPPFDIPIVASNIVATVVPSQTTVGGADILHGNGTAEENHIIPLALGLTGSLDNVEKGDAVYIDRSDDTLLDAGAAKVGTYITRHAVEPDAGEVYKAETLSTPLGPGNGFVTVTFPTIVSINTALFEMTVDDTSMLPPGGGRLFVAVRSEDLGSAVLATFRQALFSVDYTGYVGNVISLGIAGTWRWADDTPVAAIPASITNALVVGKQVGWHDTAVGGAGPTAPGTMDLDVSIRGGGLPDDSSVVGHHLNPGVVGVDNATRGVHELVFTSPHGTVTLNQGVIDVVAAPAAAGEARVTEATPHANETFDATNAVPVYDGVPSILGVQVSMAQGVTLNDPNAHAAGTAGVACLLPQTVADVEFFALGGLFLEPSTPQSLPNLAPALGPRVVDATRSLAALAVGMRSPGVAEDVHFEVRRVRRWHGAQNAINNAFAPLRYAYEIRRGRVTDYTRNGQQVGTLTASGYSMNWDVGVPFPRTNDVWSDGSGPHIGTNLGAFDSEDVNINPGDTVRLLDDDDVVVDEGIVSEVGASGVLKIAAPGFAALTEAQVAAGTRRFKVYIRQAPVPHEQSNEELLDLITDSVVHETVADYSDADPQNWVGGYVPGVVLAGVWADISNKLYDDSASPPDFAALGVRKDDIVVIDPMGTLPVVDERGFRPLGDRGVPTRTEGGGGPTPYQAGAVSSLDDNRGFYRVNVVAASHLELDPAHLFAGPLDNDVAMGGARTDIQYAVYPTVSTSVLNADVAPPGSGEGQNDLRPTRKAVAGSFTSAVAVEDKHSMRPFSYRIIRPSSMFSDEVVETVLMIRERMLSLIEMFRAASRGEKGGFYWDWQDEEHVEDLGDPLDPDSGLGLFPNRLITTLVGETSYSPFVNTSDCLSVLDRRFWVLDRKLDSLEPDPNNDFAMQAVTAGPPGYPDQGGPYTAYLDAAVGGSEVRPVLPDHLGMVLDSRDRLRGIRYTWLAYRTHRFIGTLARMAAFDAELPRKLAERKRALLLDQTAEQVT